MAKNKDNIVKQFIEEVSNIRDSLYHSYILTYPLEFIEGGYYGRGLVPALDWIISDLEEIINKLTNIKFKEVINQINKLQLKYFSINIILWLWEGFVNRKQQEQENSQSSPEPSQDVSQQDNQQELN